MPTLSTTPTSTPLRDFLGSEWPVEHNRLFFESALAEAEKLNMEASGKISEARLIEEETVRKLKLCPERNYSIRDFTEFLHELKGAETLRAEARVLGASRIGALQRLLAD